MIGDYIKWNDVNVFTGRLIATVPVASTIVSFGSVSLKFYKTALIVAIEMSAKVTEGGALNVQGWSASIFLSGLDVNNPMLYNDTSDGAQWIIEENFIRGDVFRYASANTSILVAGILTLNAALAGAAQGTVFYNIFYVIP